MQKEALVTDEEMSALLETPNSEAAGGGQDKRRRVVPYNFRRPDRLSKEQVRSLYLLHDMFSHSLSSSLPIFLRAISEVTLISVEQQAYVEYLYGLPDPTAIFTLSMQPLQGVAVLELNPSVAFPVIDRLLGGSGVALTETRAVTEIEQKVLEGFLKVVIDDLRDAWNPLIELEMEVVGRETRPQLLQIVAPNEVVLSIVFHVQIGEARGMMSLCIPAITLEPIIQKFNQSSYSRSREVPPAQTRNLLDTLSNVNFPVAAELHGTKAAMDDLLCIAPGDVLRLEHRVGQPMQVSVGGVVKFTGELAAHDDRLAIYLKSLMRNE
ncbi:MAG TPA: flagellar motor switch protein FliM [Pyrinomonadaceae bacterium]|nr:flagellar motor switch protein FliM [Pyrinomonadaceae bacterium]